MIALGSRRLWCALSLAALAVLLPACASSPDESAPALDPHKQAVIDFWHTLGEATTLRRQERYADAARLYEKALEHDPRHEDALYYLGHCREQTGDLRGAREAFAKLLEVNPNSARGQMAMGSLLARPAGGAMLDLEAAEAHFRRAHELNKEETGPTLRLGEVLLARGKIPEARRWLLAAAETNPRCVEAPFLLGYILWSGGDVGKAREQYAKALKAAEPVAPVKQAAGEGDPKPAPPLASPMGQTLFGGVAASLRSAASNPTAHAPASEEMDGSYHAVRRLIEALNRGGRAGA